MEKIEFIKTRLIELLGMLRSDSIIGTERIIGVYLHGSYPWTETPNDIDLFIITEGSAPYTHITNEKLATLGKKIYNQDISVRIEMVGIEYLKEVVAKREKETTRVARIARRRAILLYGYPLLAGVDLYQNSGPSEANFSILRDDLLADANLAQWPDIKNDPVKVSRKRTMRFHEAWCMEKMFGFWPKATKPKGSGLDIRQNRIRCEYGI